MTPDKPHRKTWILAFALLLAILSGALYVFWPDSDANTDGKLVLVGHADVEPLANSELILDDLGGDGWPLEAISSKLHQQFGQLEKSLQKPVDFIKEFEKLFAADATITALDRAQIETVYRQGSLEIQRWRAADDSSTRRGPFKTNLAAWIGTFDLIEASQTNRRASFRIQHVAERGELLATQCLISVSGVSLDDRTCEIHGTWNFSWSKTGLDQYQITKIEVLQHEWICQSSPVTRWFKDVTGSLFADIANVKQQVQQGSEKWIQHVVDFPLDGHNGLAVGDVDGNGLDDFYLCQGKGLPNRLLIQNTDGTVTDRSEDSGIDFLDSCRSALFVDFDNDGDQDLVTSSQSELLFASNFGDGRFRIAKRISTGRNAFSLLAADYDQDGDLDLYVCMFDSIDRSDQLVDFPYPMHDAKNGGRNLLLKNVGNVNFIDTTNEAGLDTDNSRFTRAASWVDLDNDSDIDLYVANDFGPNQLYRNEGGRFYPVAAELGVADPAFGTSVSWADYNRDGYDDLFVGNVHASAADRISAQPNFYASDTSLHKRYGQIARGSSLYRSSQNGAAFVDATSEARIALGRWAWSTPFIDINNDGWEDIFVANGNLTREYKSDLSSFFWRQVVPRNGDNPNSARQRFALDRYRQALLRMIHEGNSLNGQEPNGCYLNTHGKGFANVSATSGLDFADDSRAAAVVDWDQDGDYDLLVSNRTAPTIRLLLNESTIGNHFVSLKLQGTQSNRDAIGARITIRMVGDERPLTKFVSAGTGFLSQNSKRLVFGLGANENIESVQIRWPNGALESITGIKSDGHFMVVEGTGQATSTLSERKIKLHESAIEPSVKSKAVVRAVVPVPFEIPFIEFQGQDQKWYSPQNQRDHIKLVNFWASWSQPSRQILQELNEVQAELGELGVDIYAISTDNVDGNLTSTEDTSAAVETMGLDFAWGAAAPSTMEKLQILRGELFRCRKPFPTPTSFLLNSKNQLVAIYFEKVDIDQLKADIQRLATEESSTDDYELGFSGRWASSESAMNYARLAQLFERQGFPAQAQRYVELSLPQRAIAECRKAADCYSRREFAKAANHLRSAIEYDPSHVDAYVELGNLLMFQIARFPRTEAERRKESAQSNYEKAIELDVTAAEAYFGLARIATLKRNTRRAIQLLEQGLYYKPAATYRRATLGRLMGQQGQYYDGAVHLTQAFEENPEDPSIVSDLAVLYSLAGEYKKAIRYFGYALKRKPGDVKISRFLANALFLDGQFTASQQTYEIVLDSVPHDFNIKLKLAWLLATNPDEQARDGKRAVELGNQAVELLGDREYMGREVLAAAYAEAGDFELAVEMQLNAIKQLMDSRSDTSREIRQTLKETLQSYEQKKPIQMDAPNQCPMTRNRVQ